MKKVLALLMMPFLAVPAMAQEEIPEVKVTTVTVPDSYWEDASDENSRVLATTTFKDNWFWGVQFGGMKSWTTNYDAASLFRNLNFAYGMQAGKWLAPWLGLRAQVLYGHNRGQLLKPDVVYHFRTFGVNFDMMLNLTNLFCNFKENRKFNLIALAGIGWSDTGKYNTNDPRLHDVGHKTFLVPQLGLMAKFRMNEKWDFNVEVMNNWITSKFDHQRFDGKYDGYIGIYAGLTYRFKNHDGSRDFHHEMYNASRYDYLNDMANKLRAQAEAKRNAPPIINVQKKVVEGNLIRTLISFEDGKSNINKLQEVNVFTAAEDYKKLSDASIYIMPYGDTKPANVELFVERANTVKDQLMNQYNVPAGRIIIESNPQIIKNLTEQNAVVVFINE